MPTLQRSSNLLWLLGPLCVTQEGAVQHFCTLYLLSAFPLRSASLSGEHDKIQLCREFSCISSIGPTAQGLCSIQASYTEHNANRSASLVSSIYGISKLSRHQHPQEMSYCCTQWQNSWLSGLETYISEVPLSDTVPTHRVQLLSFLGAKIVSFSKVIFLYVSSPYFPGLP